MRALLRRYPGLALTLPRVNLRVVETPVERWTVDGVTLLAKRDDLTAPTLGGNKVRALELLLAGVGPDHTLLTVGSAGSTHALAVAEYGARLGARREVITWPQETHEVSLATAARLERLARVTRARNPADAYLRAAIRRMRGGVHWVPAGGSTALGAIGYVSAALELVSQLERARIPLPDSIVVPLGTGGTAAGILAGLAIAGVSTRVVGVRVVPSVVANRRRVVSLARQCLEHLSHLAASPLPRVDASRLEIEHDSYGGAYARETDAARDAARLLTVSGGPRLDGTYSAKAFGAALARARNAPDGRVLFWLTFDARWLSAATEQPRTLRPPR